MYSTKKSVLVLFFFLLSISNVYSNEKVFFIDLDLVIKDSNYGKKILDNINKINEENISILKKNEGELRSIEEDIKKKQNILSQDELNKEIAVLKKKVNVFNTEKDNMVNELNKTRKESIKNFFEKVSPIIQTYMEENSISILLDRKNVFIGRVNSDITTEIIDRINDQLK